MWEGCQRKICGGRTNYSYLNHTRAEMDKDTQEFKCPDNYTACSTNNTLGGSTVCIKEGEEECPVSKLSVYSLGSMNEVHALREQDPSATILASDDCDFVLTIYY